MQNAINNFLNGNRFSIEELIAFEVFVLSLLIIIMKINKFLERKLTQPKLNEHFVFVVAGWPFNNLLFF